MLLPEPQIVEKVVKAIQITVMKIVNVPRATNHGEHRVDALPQILEEICVSRATDHGEHRVFVPQIIEKIVFSVSQTVEKIVRTDSRATVLCFSYTLAHLTSSFHPTAHKNNDCAQWC